MKKLSLRSMIQEQEIKNKIHLARRSVFFTHFNELKKCSLEKQLDQLFKKSNPILMKYDLPEFDLKEYRTKSGEEKRAIQKKWRNDVLNLNNAWLHKMTHDDTGLVEMMTYFWHGHFACETNKNPYLTLNYNNVLRENALGNFKNLLLGVAKSPAMVNYLHLKQNKKGKPNEDFARELMELFTLGRDNGYTEADIIEVARCFTGWSIDKNGKYMFRKNIHDYGEKTVFGKTGTFSGEDVLDMILDKKECAHFIASKIYRFFVNDELNNKHVELLGDALFDANYDIKAMMRFLFEADWFYESKGKLIKSPVRMIVEFAKMFELELVDHSLYRKSQAFLGETLFDPPNVAGWPGGTKWIDTSRLAFRMRIGSVFTNKGILQWDSGEEIDAQKQKMGGKKLNLSESINWKRFWKNNEGIEIYDLLISVNNAALREALNNKTELTVTQLISTPDYQLA